MAKKISSRARNIRPSGCERTEVGALAREVNAKFLADVIPEQGKAALSTGDITKVKHGTKQKVFADGAIEMASEKTGKPVGSFEQAAEILTADLDA